MAAKWRQSEWGHIATLEYGKSLRDYQEAGSRYRVYGTNGPIGWHDEPLCKHSGVIIGRKGAYRGVHYSSEPFFVIDTAFYLEPKEDMDLRWAYYCLLTYDINGMDSGSAIPSTSRESFYRLPVRVPPKKEQQAIACVLGALDDKIDVNHQMSRGLEAMSQALFKSWFLSFDPVRAKAAGQKPPGLDSATAAIFPNRLEDSNVGEIPKGWRAATIRQLSSNVQYGLTQSASTAPVGPKFLRITDIQGGRVDWSAVPYCVVSPEEHERYRLKSGDVLVARTGASTGENIYLPVAPDAVFASYLVRFQFTDPATARLVGAFMRTAAYFDFVAGSIGGSAQPNASAQVLASASLIVPPPEIARRFAEIVAPVDARIAANSDESRTLSALRDALLPKLISGEMRLSDAERIVQRCI